MIGALDGHRFRKVHALQARKLARRFHRRGLIDLLAGHDAGGLRAALAQRARQLARVDSGDRHQAAALEEGAQRLDGAPIIRRDRQIADHKPGCINLRSFKIFRSRTGVTDVRIGERDNLAGVGGVGQNFLVARQSGIENDFAGGVAFGSDGVAAEDRSIRQRQHRGYCCHGLRPTFESSRILARIYKAGGVLIEHPPALHGLTQPIAWKVYGRAPDVSTAGVGFCCPVECCAATAETFLRSCFGKKNIAHRIKPLRLGRKPGGSLQRAARKNGAVRCPMRERELLAGACKEHRVLTDEIPARTIANPMSPGRRGASALRFTTATSSSACERACATACASASAVPEGASAFNR